MAPATAASGGSWVESYTGMSSDNIKGLVLALSSSFFIGASFIVKKKGLKKAGASGVRAGAGGYSYLYEPLWWVGMIAIYGIEKIASGICSKVFRTARYGWYILVRWFTGTRTARYRAVPTVTRYITVGIDCYRSVTCEID
ncbi:hypothetical protein BHM03_00043069 [Ensete ventricosum]|nr:hypothetical protein BHM03_00043069 [Ensete ventricosum]